MSLCQECGCVLTPTENDVCDECQARDAGLTGVDRAEWLIDRWMNKEGENDRPG